jgi:ABC-type bacteriocin/lantibiotic exporter with double-glycine peptidase domain
MVLEKNPKVRPFARKLLELEDAVSGRPFPRMKRVKQASPSHCGPAVLASLFSNFGIKVSQKRMVASLRAQNKIKKYGLNIRDLARASRMIGKGTFAFWRKFKANVSDLNLAINKYRSPVGVEWQGVFYEDEDGDCGHYSIITRVEKKSGFLRVADPYSKFAGTDRKFAIKDFTKRWWDVNEVKKRTVLDRRVAFLITPKSDSWPKKIGMRKI